MAIPVATQEKWLLQIEELDLLQIAALLTVYENALASVCAAHHELVEAVAFHKSASVEDLRSMIAAWAMQQSRMIDSAQSDILGIGGGRQ